MIRGCENCRRYGVAGDGRADSRKNFQFGILTTIALFQFNHPHYKDVLSSLLFKYVADIPLGSSMKIARYCSIWSMGFVEMSTQIVEKPAG